MLQFFIRVYGRALGPKVHRTAISFLLGLIVALVIVSCIAKVAKGHTQMAWLTVIYYPVPSAKIPKVKLYRIEASVCELQAKQLYADFYALRAQAFCLGV